MESIYYTFKKTPSTAQKDEVIADLRSQLSKQIEMNARIVVQIRDMHAENETLKAGPKTPMAMQKRHESEKKKLFNETVDLKKELRQCNMRYKYDIERLEKEAEKKVSESHKRVAALKKKHESDILRLNEDWEMKLAKGKAKWEAESAQKKREHDKIHVAEMKELKSNHFMEVTKYQLQLASLEEKLDQQKLSFSRVLSAKKLENIRITDELRELKEERWELKRIVCDQNDLTAEIYELREAVREKDAIIQKQEGILASLSEDKAMLWKDWLLALHGKTSAETSLNDVIKGHASLRSKLQSELYDSKTWQKKTGEQLLKALDTKNYLLSQKNNLTALVAEQKQKIRQLESTQRRFKADLEACSTSMSDFKSLKSKYIELCKRYLHNYRPNEVKLDQHLEDEPREKIASADRKLSFYRKFTKNDLSNLSRTQVYVDKVNKLEKENYSLRQDLRRTQLLLQKATQPVQQRVKSWIDKKSGEGHLLPQRLQRNHQPITQLTGSLPTSQTTISLPNSQMTTSHHLCIPVQANQQHPRSPILWMVSY
ncbi:hypothetical protein ABVT39_017535 [Epinephelus coioides]